MSSFRKKSRLGLSSVVSSIILSATVLVVGGMIWGYANGASTVIADQYHEDTMELVEVIKERYMIEHITNTDSNISIWIYNYGDVDIELVVNVDTNVTDYSNGTRKNPLVIPHLSSKEITISIPFDVLEVHEDWTPYIGVNIISGRDNIVYYSYIAH